MVIFHSYVKLPEGILILITLPCYIRNKMLEFVACVMCVVAHADIQNKQPKIPNEHERYVQNTGCI